MTSDKLKEEIGRLYDAYGVERTLDQRLESRQVRLASEYRNCLLNAIIALQSAYRTLVALEAYDALQKR